MSVFALKIVAMVTMLADHLGFALFNNYLPMRMIGRIAFPIYALLIAEGYRHLRSDREKLNTHITKFVILTTVSEFCYDLMEFGLNFSLYGESQSNMPTLFLGLLGLIIIDRYKEKPFVIISTVLMTSYASVLLKANFKMMGPILIYMLYWYLETVFGRADKAEILPIDGQKKEFGYIKRSLILLAIFVVFTPPYHYARWGFPLWEEYVSSFMEFAFNWYLVYLIIPFIFALYDGKKGYNSKKFSICYSWFYPVHMLLIGILALLIA